MLAAVMWAVAIVFGAGGAWKTLKDLKGVSGKVNRVENKMDSQYLALSLAILEALPEKDRATWAGVLHKGRN